MEPKRRINAAWRADAECRVHRLRACLKGVAKSNQGAADRVVDLGSQLDIVDEVLDHRATIVEKWKGADIERAWVHLHDVQVAIVELTEAKNLNGELPRAYGLAKRVLEPDDPQLTKLKALADSPAVLDDAGRDVLANTMRSANAAKAGQHRQLRSFRNTLFAAAGALFVFALLLGIVGLFIPDSVNLCVGANVCPTGTGGPHRGDIFVVELLGVFGATIIGSLAVRHMQGTETPYAVLLAALLVKLPTGALTAVGGLLLLKAGFVAGIGPMSAPAMEAYAVLFGASQQAVTQLLDRQTQTVLNNVGTKDTKDAKEPAKT